MAKKKYLIIGQGIAGSVLALEMYHRKMDFVVVDQPKLSSSSKIAAGVVNPVVLKRLKMVQGAENFLDHSESFYKLWQNNLQSEFYHQIPICHLFWDQESQNNWMEKSANLPFSRFLGVVNPKSPRFFNPEYGFGKMKETSWMDTFKFLNQVRQYLKKEGRLEELEIEWKNLKNLKEKHQASEIIICNGHLLKEQGSYSQLFSATRGELLTIRSSDIPEDVIFHAGVFILPIGNKHFKVGATYHWDNLRDEPSEDGKTKLIKQLEKMFSGNYEIVKHEAGVRPNTQDRKPLLGKKDGHYIFNGLGSRGVLMAPYLANILVDNLEKGLPIPKEYDIKRFFD